MENMEKWEREKAISQFETLIKVCLEDGCDFVDVTFDQADIVLRLLKEQQQEIEKQEEACKALFNRCATITKGMICVYCDLKKECDEKRTVLQSKSQN